MPYMIEVSHLAKEFRSARSPVLNPFFSKKKETTLAVDNISMGVRKGESFGILGENGAGKTTLIKMLCCLILPTSGSAKVGGFDILTDIEEVKATIGLVSSDERSFYWRLTGRQNLHFFSSLHNLSRVKARSRIGEIADCLEIKELDKRFQEYSAGMKQKLAFARAFINDPDILLIDEPTRSLDSKTAWRLREFIKEKFILRQNKTVLFATHNLDEAEYLADRLAIMNKGRIAASGTINELQEKAGNAFATLKEIFNCFTEKRH